MQSLTNNSVQSQKIDRVDRRFSFIALSVVTTLLLVGIFRHEMWRDELQAWCIARDSATLLDVHRHLLYEGHPISWYLPLFVFSRFTHDPLTMQLFNVVLMAATCFLVLAYSPFNKLQKILFCLGYFPLFEYGIISRSYSLELLVIVVFCCLFKFRNQHPWWLFSSLIVLASVNAYGLMIACAFTATLIVQYWLSRKETPFPKQVTAFGTVLVISAAALTVIQMSAPADGYHGEMTAIKEKQPKRLFKALRAIPIAYAPIPNFEAREFWNTDIVSRIENETAIYVIVLAVLMLCVVLLYTRPVALFMYAIGTGGLVLFSFTHLLGGLRQQGHLFIVLFCSFWLAHYVTNKEVGPNLAKSISTDSARSLFLTFVLILQSIAGGYAYYQDLIRPFSSAKLVARFIKQKGLSDMLIIGSNDHEMSSVSGYLDRKIYCPESKTYIGFVVNNTSRHNIEFEELSLAAKQVMDDRHTNDALLILNYPLGAIPNGFQVECLNQFDQSIQADEKFYLYRITRAMK
jgi:hypothetical protein